MSYLKRKRAFIGFFRKAFHIVLLATLSLAYNSASGNGMIGMGWMLNGINFIMVEVTRLLPQNEMVKLKKALPSLIT